MDNECELVIQKLDVIDSLLETAPLEALREFRDLERDFSEDFNIVYNRGAYLINIGSMLRELSLIEEGIAAIKTLEGADGSLPFDHLYNLGNGYYAAEDCRRGPNYDYNPIETPMVEAKRYYRLATVRASQLKEDWREDDNDEAEVPPDTCALAMLHTNYALSLRELGRIFEAADEFEVALTHDPEHPVAWSGIGDVYRFLAIVFKDFRLLEVSMHAFEEALLNQRLETYGYSYMRPEIEADQDEVIKQLRLVKHDCPCSNRRTRAESKRHQAYLEFCQEKRLFLTQSLPRCPSRRPDIDNILLKTLITPLSEKTSLLRLSRTFNELRERFATTRLLMFEALEPPYSVPPFDALTSYIDLHDCSVYGVRVAKLKLAFEGAYNLLDKVHFFLNHYLELGVPEEQVRFDTVWKQGGKNSSIRQKILERRNIFLMGLYDLMSDFNAAEFWGKFSRNRNRSTHRYLVVHAFEWNWRTEDGESYHIEWQEMVDQTIHLLQLVRQALLYLFAAVEVEEQAKLEEDKKREKRLIAEGMGFWFHDPRRPLI